MNNLKVLDVTLRDGGCVNLTSGRRIWIKF